MRLWPIESKEKLEETHQNWIEKELKKTQPVRQSKRTQSIAVGAKENSLDQLSDQVLFQYREMRDQILVIAPKTRPLF
jgi:uncharacterized HAD superfamily protein